MYTLSLKTSRNIQIYSLTPLSESAPWEGIKPTDKSDTIDAKTLWKIKDYAQKVIDIFSENPKAEEKFKDQLYSLVSDITSNPARVKILLEKVSSSDKLSDQQKTNAMLDIMERLSIQNPELNLSHDLNALRQNILSGASWVRDEVLSKLHEMRLSLKPWILKI